MGRTGASVKKNTLGITVVLLVLFVILLVFFLPGKEKHAVPFLSQYDIFFGDSPRTVATKIPCNPVGEEQLNYTNQTLYTYSITILGSEAVMNCFFIGNRYLTEVDIIIPGVSNKQLSDLFDQAKAILIEEYQDRESFRFGDTVYTDDQSYYLSLDMSNGATGLNYMLLVTGNELHISCVDCR